MELWEEVLFQCFLQWIVRAFLPHFTEGASYTVVAIHPVDSKTSSASSHLVSRTCRLKTSREREKKTKVWHCNEAQIERLDLEWLLPASFESTIETCCFVFCSWIIIYSRDCVPCEVLFLCACVSSPLATTHIIKLSRLSSWWALLQCAQHYSAFQQ